MKKRIASAAVLAAGALLVQGESGVEASSHREAPFITKMPKVDATDFYMFKSYEADRGEFVTLIADYLPLQDAYGGPNYFTMDPQALYEIHIDNDGDAKEDITFQFRFTSTLASDGKGITIPVGPSGNTKDVAIPLPYVGPATSAGNLNVAETYTVSIVRGNRRTGAAASLTKAGTSTTTFEKPFDNVGAKTTPGYRAYAQGFVFDVDIPGCTPPNGKKARVFVGQRKDPFVVNLGQIFDLLNFNALGSNNIPGTDKLDDKNVTALELEVPASCLTKSGGSTTIGGWTTASVRQARVVNPSATYAQPSREGGPWAQVSRLGMPLVNEVVIGLPDKDRFNSSEPKDDAQFATYVTNPTLPELIEIVYGAAGVTATAPNAFPRNDLVAVFLTGVPSVNNTGATPSEMLRLNTALPATPKGAQTNLGAALCFDHGALNTNLSGCDVAGFPNGRRPGDDVVDIAIRVVMGYLLPESDAPVGQAPFTDNAFIDDSFFDASFPYLLPPLPGSP